jgi:translation elongation factor EF-1alpha
MSTISERIKKLTAPGGVNINLICMGVGSGFPTFVGMELREKYHKGLSSIPACFLVSDWRTEFETNFYTIKSEYIKKLEQVQIIPGAKRLPWDEKIMNLIFESSNFITEEPQVNINGVQVFTLRANDLSKSQLEEMFRGWTQEIQLMSLKSSVRNEATICVNFMEFLYKTYEENISGSGTSGGKKVLTVLERLSLKDQKSGTHLLQSLIGECKRMRDGVSLKDLSQEEAAKRLAIGTQQGKFHSKALQMRGLDASEYEKFKEEFLNKLANCKINPETTQEASFILLQNQKEIFLETTLPTAIQKCNSYELVEAMPMIGHTLFIRRTDQSMINPYTIQVVSIPRINTVCDTISLVSQGNEMEISIGNEEEEKFNAVLPLFEESDKDIKHLIRSKLYHLLMTFNTMRNVDTFYYEAYAGLLANTLVRLLKYDDSSWKNKMIDMVHNTTEMVYGENPSFERSIELLLTDPRGAMVTEHKTEKHKCEDVSKMMLNLLLLKKRGKVDEKQCSEIIKFMLIEHCGRSIKEGTNIFEAFYGSDFKEDFRSKANKKDRNDKKTTKDENDLQDDKDKSTTVNTTVVNNTESLINPPSTEVYDDINSYYPEQTHTQVINIQSNPDSNMIDINFVPQKKVIKLSEEKVENNFAEEESLDKIVDKFIKSREHIKFDSIRDLKANLKKIFLEYTSKSKNENKMNIRLVASSFNKAGFRLNFSFFYDLHHYFCPNLEFDDKLFFIAVNHALKNRDSHDRSVNPIDENYEKVREEERKKFFDKQEKDLKEKMYESFESPIIQSYLSDFKNAMTMIRDFNCTTDLLKNTAEYDSSKPFVNVVFFGPSHSGKSSLIGRLMSEFKCLDNKIFSYYKNAYKTFYPNRENFPYEWISNTSVDERCKDKTININVNYLNLPKKLVNIYDTPGKYNLYRHTLSAISLVDHFFLCVEPNMEKIMSEFDLIKSTFGSLGANNCVKLYIVLTKCENYLKENVVEVIEEVKKLFNETLDKFKLKIEIEVLPVSAYSGEGIENLGGLLQSLNKIESTVTDSESQTKLLVLDTIDDKFGGKVLYVQPFGKEFRSGCSVVAYPSLKTTKLTSVEVNYKNSNDTVKPGQYCCVGLTASSSSLGIEKGSVLHLNDKKQPTLDGKDSKIKIINVKMSVKHLGTTKWKVGTCIKVEFKYFNQTLQITEMLGQDGTSLTDSNAGKGQLLTLTLVPTSSVYFENLWADTTNGERVIIRGQHYKLEAAGKILSINYNTK